MTGEQQRRMNAVLLAALIGAKDSAEAISLLVGALTLACGRTERPAVCLSVAIDSLDKARSICLEHVDKGDLS